jgi:transcriptional regulator with XRE-family HTH domain
MEVPASLWQRDAMTEALRGRDMGRALRLVRQYSGISQTQMAIAFGMTQAKVSNIMRGVQHVATLNVFERIADGLSMPGQARIVLGLAPPATPVRDALATTAVSRAARPLSVEPSDREEGEDQVRRRSFVGLTGASLFGAVVASATPSGPLSAVEAFAAALADPRSAGSGEAPTDLNALSTAVATAKRSYQSCRYTEVIKTLPVLLSQVQAAGTAMTGDDGLKAHALSAESHHVAASVLLKLGDQGLALLAAERSMQAAQASEDPLTIGSSARIITHALMRNGHLGAATSASSSYAAWLDHGVTAHGPESLSVYGSLLLRGAVAAAQRGDRAVAYALLTEASDAGRRLGVDGNVRWTAFGPVNVKLHDVNIAVTLGDAGAAIDTARDIDLAQVTLTERKAGLLIDTARAFLQHGKYENAYLTLRAARDVAPQEIAGRPAVHQVVRDLVTIATPSVQRQAAEFAGQVGIPL